MGVRRIAQWLLFLPLAIEAQTNSYHISFPNAVHHEAVVTINFPDVEGDTLEVRMSRSSPGRYALHEFAKNVYGFEASDEHGKPLKVFRRDPYSWFITGHSGTVKIRYLLYADRGDGTYSQIDETHAHLNIPATFMFAPVFTDRAVEVTFKPRKDLNWKVATQLEQLNDTTFRAPNLQYFMDSPTELSDFSVRQFKVSPENDPDHTIRFVLHHDGSEEQFDEYFEQVKKVVLTAKQVYGELPAFDFGTYTFLACYMPQVSGDGMEHRNSTVLTSTRALQSGGMAGNISTVAHEFFHAWNVERLRPKSLEPFDFEKVNMSGALWFAEGFTSYYTDLILCRAGLIAPGEYISGLTATFNYVWNSPARKFFNPVEMSYQAPFVDAATSVDPVNRQNTFISYYSYGSMLGLALDLSLREKGLSLDGYMQLLWDTYGANEIPYTIADLQQNLNQYAGEPFGEQFFESFIHHSGMPDYERLFAGVGVSIHRDKMSVYLGVSLSEENNNEPAIRANPTLGSPAYEAGLERGDILISINEQAVNESPSISALLGNSHPGDTLQVAYRRYGRLRSTRLVLGSNPSYTIRLEELDGNQPSGKAIQNRKSWLIVQ